MAFTLTYDICSLWDSLWATSCQEFSTHSPIMVGLLPLRILFATPGNPLYSVDWIHFVGIGRVRPRIRYNTSNAAHISYRNHQWRMVLAWGRKFWNKKVSKAKGTLTWTWEDFIWNSNVQDNHDWGLTSIGELVRYISDTGLIWSSISYFT